MQMIYQLQSSRLPQFLRSGARTALCQTSVPNSKSLASTFTLPGQHSSPKTLYLLPIQVLNCTRVTFPVNQYAQSRAKCHVLLSSQRVSLTHLAPSLADTPIGNDEWSFPHWSEIPDMFTIGQNPSNSSNFLLSKIWG